MMRIALLCAAPLLLAATSTGPADLAALSDEFTGSQLSPEWRRFETLYGWPDKLKALDVGTTTPGALHLQPYDSAWVRDRNASFLFKEVTGDFDVRARLRVRGADGPIPGGTWSLGGLMVRMPNPNRADAWEPRRENWHFLTTGVGHVPGQVMTETKSTYNSSSHLKLRPFVSGWVELRLVRVGNAIFALARPDGGDWEVRDRFYRMDAPPATQVGLIAYTSSDDEKDVRDNHEIENLRVKADLRVDMFMDVDWVRFSRPITAKSTAEARVLDPIAAWYAQVNGDNALTDPNLDETDLLRLLGE